MYLGIELITLALWRISSPIRPFPRVSAEISCPLEYFKLQVSPSILSIAILSFLPIKDATSSMDLVLSRDSIE